MSAIVQLEDAEWQAVLAMISLGPWRDANPLLMKIGAQLRAQQQQAPIEQPQPGGAPIKQTAIHLNSDGKEVRHG